VKWKGAPITTKAKTWKRNTLPGTIASTTHGMTHTKEFIAWCGMKQRCLNPKHKSFKRYGGRGITICDRWLKFENFFADMGYAPAGFTLDRRDNDKGYFPDNCRWASPKHQGRNRRNNRKIILGGVEKTLAEWCENFGRNYYTVHYRLTNGWPVRMALSTPADPNRKRRPSA
jgi:hypothetical protein